MRIPQPDVLSRWFRVLTGTAARDVDSDAELLRRFLDDQDEAAFGSLLHRHGPMVLGVCRRLLRDVQTVEDAFQATFLVLLRRGVSIRRRELLANWLYGVAYRIAMQARRAKREVELREAEALPMREPGPAEMAARHELERMVNEEIQRLPKNYRRAIVLCYLQGHSYTEAARQLGRPPGTVATWLARGRERLRVRLARRGLAMSTGLLATVLAAERLTAAVPAKLVEATLTAAASLLGGQIGTISPHVLSLYQGVSTTMLRTKLGFLALLLLGVAAGGVYVLTSGAAPGDKPGAGREPPPGQKDAEDKAPGPIQGKLENVSGFTVIALTGAAKVTVKQTGKESVAIKGDKDLVQASSARVEKGTLMLLGGVGPVNVGTLVPVPAVGGVKLPVPAAGDLVEFVVEVKDLNGLILNGLGSMDVSQVKTKSLTVTVAGSGDLTVSGKADVLEVTVTGTGNFLGYQLATQGTTVKHLGIGKAVVNAAKELNVNIIGNGSVEYVGSPQVRQSILGLGSVTKKR